MDPVRVMEERLAALRQAEARARAAAEELELAKVEVEAARAGVLSLMDPKLRAEEVSFQAIVSPQPDYMRLHEFILQMTSPKKDYHAFARLLYGPTDPAAHVKREDYKRATMQFHYLKTKGLVVEKEDGTIHANRMAG